MLWPYKICDFVGDESFVVERHLCGDGEAVAVGVGSPLEGVPHARIQHLLPGFEPPQKEMEIKTFLNDEGGFYSGILFMMII